jgi:hypothetical protein
MVAPKTGTATQRLRHSRAGGIQLFCRTEIGSPPARGRRTSVVRSRLLGRRLCGDDELALRDPACWVAAARGRRTSVCAIPPNRTSSFRPSLPRSVFIRGPESSVVGLKNTEPRPHGFHLGLNDGGSRPSPGRHDTKTCHRHEVSRRFGLRMVRRPENRNRNTKQLQSHVTFDSFRSVSGFLTTLFCRLKGAPYKLAGGLVSSFDNTDASLQRASKTTET